MELEGSNVPSNVPPMIGFNVGGKVFLTTYSTISSRGKNFLTNMIDGHYSGRMKSLMVDNALFIDRNGAAFEYVLQILRGGGVSYAGSVTKKMLFEELCFYQVAMSEEEADYFNIETEARKLFDVTMEHSSTYKEALRFSKESLKFIYPCLIECAKQGLSLKQFALQRSLLAGNYQLR